MLRGGLDTVGKTGYTLLRSHIQILQVVLTAGGDIQLHLCSAAVRGALDAPQIGNQSAKLHAGEFIDQSLEQVIRICHLGHLFGVHEGADLDHGEAGVHQVPQKESLSSVETMVFSFWRPSRRPTSQMVISEGRFIIAGETSLIMPARRRGFVENVRNACRMPEHSLASYTIIILYWSPLFQYKFYIKLWKISMVEARRRTVKELRAPFAAAGGLEAGTGRGLESPKGGKSSDIMEK